MEDKQGEYRLPELRYGYDALEPHYSGELLELHHSKHHAAYVKGINATMNDLREVRSSGDYSTINMYQKNMAFHLSGHVLHSIFWRNLSPDGGGDPTGRLADELNSAFGSLDGFREHMSRAALSIQGSGWAALSWEPVGSQLTVEQVFDHQGNIGNGTIPLLVLDMWEHAFYLQYRTDKQKWVNNYWELVDWQDVSGRLDSVSRLELNL